MKQASTSPNIKCLYLYKYEPYGSQLVVLSYVNDCVYWYTSDELVKWFLDTAGQIFHAKFLEYTHWFMSIRISQLGYHSISVHQARYATSDVDNCLENAKMLIYKFHKNNLTHDMVLTKYDVSNSDEQVEKLSRE